MTTYEQGRAPEGAPVTWFLLPHSTAMACIRLPDGSSIDAHRLQADAACRAFHVAKLAEEAAAMSAESVQGVAWINPTTAFADWLRRYREAVR